MKSINRIVCSPKNYCSALRNIPESGIKPEIFRLLYSSRKRMYPNLSNVPLLRFCTLSQNFLTFEWLMPRKWSSLRSWELLSRFSNSQLLWNPKFQYRVNKSSPLDWYIAVDLPQYNDPWFWVPQGWSRFTVWRLCWVFRPLPALLKLILTLIGGVQIVTSHSVISFTHVGQSLGLFSSFFRLNSFSHSWCSAHLIFVILSLW
jgi:hypothetical protein